MKSSQVTAQKIAHIMEQPDDGASIEDVCRRAGISIETYYHWYKKYGGARPSKNRRLRELEEENSRLKLLVAIMGFNKMRDVSPAPNGHKTARFDRDAFEREREALLASYEEVPAVAPAQAPPPKHAPAQPAAKRAPGPRAAVPSTSQLARRFSAREPGRGPERAARLAAARQTLAKARHRARVRTAAVLRDAGKEARSQGPWARLVKARRAVRHMGAKRGRPLLLAGIAAGLVGGFAFGMQEPAAPERKSVPVDLSVRFNADRSHASTMEQGWKKPEDWGTWMADRSASVLLGFDGPSRSDVELLVEGRARAPQGAEPATVTVRFNDAELGRWRLPPQARDLRRRFIVPAAVFNRSTAAQLSFELDGSAGDRDVFGLRGVSLRDSVRLSKFRGYLDRCERDKLVGWAVAEDSAISVAATIDGKPLPAAIVNVERNDLGSHGLPTDAGFELKPGQPIAPGSTVEVRFPNGQRLIGSPCRP